MPVTRVWPVVRTCMAAVVLGSLTSCVAFNPPSRVETEPEFRPKHMLHDGAAVGAITLAHDPGIVDPYAEWEFGTLLRYAMMARWQQLDVVSPGQIERAIGTKSYENLLRSFRHDGRLPAEAIDQLRQTVPARYIVFGRVERDFVQVGDPDAGPYDVAEVSTTRALTMQFVVYDLTWRGVVYRHRFIEELAVNEYAFDPAYDHPDPPALELVMQRAVDRFVRVLAQSPERSREYRGYPDNPYVSSR